MWSFVLCLLKAHLLKEALEFGEVATCFSFVRHSSEVIYIAHSYHLMLCPLMDNQIVMFCHDHGWPVVVLTQ